MKNGEWKMGNGKETVADVVRQIGLCIVVGMACGWFDNRLDRIEERISDVDRRIALLAEELGDKKPDEGGDDSVYGRSERREEKTPEASDPAPEGAGFKRLAPLLRDDIRRPARGTLQLHFVEKPVLRKAQDGRRHIVERVVVDEPVLLQTGKQLVRLFVHGDILQ